MMDQSRGGWTDTTLKLNLARVESYDYAVDKRTGEQTKDANGNPIATGLVNITVLEQPLSIPKVPFVFPMVGNSMFMGGLPEIGTLCVLGWRQQNKPVIIGFIPLGMEQLVNSRSTLPPLKEGEILLQASDRTVDDDSRSDFFRGARVHLDSYGRVQVDTQDYNLTIGYLLSNEYTDRVQALVDPVTNERVFLRERLPGGTERRVDDKGNSVWTSPGKHITRTGGDHIIESKSRMVHTASDGFSIGDERANRVALDESVLRIEAPSGALERFTQGSETVQIGGNQSTNVTGTQNNVVGEGRTDIVGGDHQTEVTGFKKESVTGKFTLQSIQALIELVATLGIVLETPSLAPIRAGSSSANEPVPLGNVLIAALGALVDHFINIGGTSLGANTGGPVVINPALVTALQAWKTLYLTAPATNVVSQKVFVERA